MKNGAALADRHRIQQVQLSAQTQRLLAEVYRRTIDPARLDETFPVYLRAASVVLGQGRAASDVLARRYYMRIASSAGFEAAALDIPLSPMNLERVETSLRVTGPVLVKTKVAEGVSLAAANQMGLAATLAAGKRIILDGGREMLIEASRRDPNVKKWARVSDGSSCSFCAMLISRGPVYGEQTASFRSHDRCGCGVRLVYANDADGGWSKDATALRSLWPDEGTLTLAEWRSIYNGARKDPDSVLNRATPALKAA
ncbi:hypothetical protein SEA_TWEETY19_5 [Arthrobacter phage Tweety19]|uniref:Uncharacterized protein n=1 Tax=Arthrobacter phage Tweety19 TaxID=2768133 RepID=A0A7G9W203_9CAUD|nr:head maturation protease [Arthrobacter phage Tweety19]QNO12666.1 hypothetical protein SEA_TWEETY19_5 [Arthrobacter phage Tweety19]